VVWGNPAANVSAVNRCELRWEAFNALKILNNSRC